MTMQTVTIEIPTPLYEQLKAHAARTQRTVEAELLDIVASAVPAIADLPGGFADAISQLSVLDDEALWRAARSHLSATAARKLERLNRKQQREGLTDTEIQAQATLLRQYERAMLVRAQAASLLKQRGHDVSGLLQSA
jgi:uncharacterized protein YnzC (UPF0291/DUF896 family)